MLTGPMLTTQPLAHRFQGHAGLALAAFGLGDVATGRNYFAPAKNSTLPVVKRV
jgi:hypothetical protein